MRKTFAFLPILAALAACSAPGSAIAPPPISANPVATANQAVASTPVGQTVQQGLLDSEWNLDQAIAIGVLQPNDAADACLHQSLTLMGIEPAPAGGTPPAPIPSFQPRVSDLISGGSVLYILAQQAKTAIGGGVSVPLACETLVGQFVMQAALPGVNAIPTAPIAAVHKR